MVFTTIKCFAKVNKIPRKYVRTAFKDSLRIYVQGGSGGNGLPKFGGIGGQGGNVIAVGKESFRLEDVKGKRFVAENGRNSSHNFILGVPGQNTKIEIPIGVTVYTELGHKLGELNAENEEIVLAKGGVGGHPKNGFLGKKGQAYNVKLELQLIADIGLVGFPNAGKSTLLKAVSHARPKIADYPFTTIRPNIGKMMYDDLRQISVADLPGLIEGAHKNYGMGHRFLRHVERTKLLLLVVDVNGFQLSPQHPFRSCLDTVMLLNKELELYDKELLKKPAVLIINKMDSDGAREKYNEIKDKLKNLKEILLEYPDEIKPERALMFDEVLAISAKTNQEDVFMVKDKLRHVIDVRAELEEKGTEENADLHANIKETLREKGPMVI